MKVFKGPSVGETNHTELLTNISVYADPSRSRLRVDLTLYPSDGSKYRVYVHVPTLEEEREAENEKEKEKKVISPRVERVRMLTMPKKTLLDLIGRLVLPSGHVVWTGGNGCAGGKIPLALRSDDDSHALDSSNQTPITMRQIKFGGAPLRPHSLLKKQETTRKVLRTSLVLGKSLWQQSRVDDAYSLMQLACVRSLEVIPVRSLRTQKEEEVKVELLQCAKRAKVVGRRDRGMAVMLLRSTFSKCLLRLMERERPEETVAGDSREDNDDDAEEEEEEENRVQNKKRLERIKKLKEEKQKKQQSDALNVKMFRLNVEKIHAERQQKQELLDAKEKTIDQMNERRASVKESERRRRQQERVDRMLEKEKIQRQRDAEVEQDEDTWYTEGKKLEQMKIEMERKDREQKKKIMLEERALKKRVALEKRTKVEAARIEAIERKAATRGGGSVKNKKKPKKESLDFGFDDGRRIVRRKR
jgi:hypothetical protein